MRESRDEQFMSEALVLAAQAIGLSDPNPRVGCVITNGEGRVIDRGHTQEAGGPMPKSSRCAMRPPAPNPLRAPLPVSRWKFAASMRSQRCFQTSRSGK